MNSSHICLACRRRLCQIRPNVTSQWQTRASFISLSNRVPRATGEENSGNSPLRPEEEVGARKGKRSRHIQDWNNNPTQSNSKNPGDLLESLFEESLKLSSSSADTPPQAFTVLEPYKNVDVLKKMLSEGGSVANCWYFFVEHFSPDIQKDAINKKTAPAYLTTTARELMKQIIQSKNKDPISQSLPSVTEVSKVYFRLGLLHGSEWSSMVFNLLENILKLRQQPTQAWAEEDQLIWDLLGSWSVVCREIGNKDSLVVATSSSIDWSHLPTLYMRDIEQSYRERGVQAAFGSLIPSFELRHLNGIPYITAATFSLVTNLQTEGRATYDVSPIINTLSPIIAAPGVEIDQVSIAERRLVPPLVSQYVTTGWPRIKQHASEIFQSSVSTGKQEAPRKSHQPFHRDIPLISKRLNDSLMKRDGRQVDELWADVSTWQIRIGKDITSSGFHHKRGILTPELCNYFILVYMGLRQPNRAIDVWNHMVKNNLFPGLATWDAMMSGCKIPRDWKASEAIWSQMRNLKVQPDAVCWTTRISVLIESYRVDDAIQALDEMGRIWLTAAKNRHGEKKLEDLLRVNDVEGAVKPTIVTINAVVVGLLRRKQPEAAHRVLAWAGKFGISPDINTYNTLLRPLVRHGDSKGVMKLLQQMERVGVQADVATFTTILDETFRHADQHTPQEQSEIVDSIFHEMEAAGIEANLHTYGKIIHGLLQNPTEDMSTINTILRRMAKQGVQASAQINTMLVSHYFTKQPSDLDAVRGLIDRTKTEVGSIDHKFWDRVIEGYSRVGETSAAVRILGKVNSTHNKVSWLTLSELITALAVNEEWDVARSIVRDAAIDSGGPLPRDVKGKEGEHKFWKLAMELQLCEAA